MYVSFYIRIYYQKNTPCTIAISVKHSYIPYIHTTKNKSSEILSALDTAPEQVYCTRDKAFTSDHHEFGIIQTTDEKGANNPASGIKVENFGIIDAQKQKEFEDLYQKLLHDISTHMSSS